MKLKSAEEVLQAIITAYTSLTKPDFHFVSLQLAQRPYDELVSSLQAHFVIEELTDPNDDVAFVYALSNPNATWILELSMVGPFAVLLRRLPETRYQLVAPGGFASNDEELLLDKLDTHGVSLLDQEMLELPVTLRLQNTPPEKSCIYNALFTDNEFLPWRAHAVQKR